jgi:hypothetical protein
MLTLGFFFKRKNLLQDSHFFFLLSLGRQATIIIRQKEKNTASNSDVSWFEGEKALIIFYCQ